jgi:hypothetical protein
MVSCLTLVRGTHILVRQAAGASETLCGLSILNDHVRKDLFAVGPVEANCPDCRRSFEAGVDRSKFAASDPDDAKSMIERMNENDEEAFARHLGQELAQCRAEGRLKRLHHLFPKWRTTIADSISEGERVVLQYRVDCTDPFGLLGSCGPAATYGQAVVFRLAEGLVVEAKAIRDDFDFWTEDSRRSNAAKGCLCHPGASSSFKCESRA